MLTAAAWPTLANAQAQGGATLQTDSAQPQSGSTVDGQQPANGQPQANDQPPAGDQGRKQAPVEQLGGTGIEQRNYMAGQRPAPPPPPRKPGGNPDQMEVAHGAGAGSPLGYARRTVVELGGTLALTHESQTTDFRIAPSVGYFFIDGLELTLFPELHIVDVDGNADTKIAGTLEPSYHLALAGSSVFGFAGIGVGLSWADDPGLDLFFRPRLGLDIMVGRSGILKPALFMDVGANDGLTSGGLEAGFTVMW
jgi:hypothetical protein